MRTLLWMLACGAEQADSAASEEKEQPVPYIFEETDPPVASLTTDEIASAISQGVDAVLDMTAAPIFAAYDEAMAGAESGCPDYYDYEGNEYWYDQCESGDGTAFSGYTFYVVYDNYDPGDGYLYNGTAINGVSQIASPDGAVFSAGGAAYVLSQEHTGTGDDDITHTIFTSIIQGAFSYDGPAGEGTWLTEGLSPNLSIQAAYAPDLDGHYIYVDGSVTDLEGAATDVVLDGLLLIDQNLYSTCPEEPAGTVSVRDASGGWYDVIFDGPTEIGASVDSALCDGCGSVYFQGEPLGSACLDFGALIAWETSPW